MTKKIQLFTLTLCLSLLGIVNTAKANTTYTLSAAGADPSNLNNWGKTSATLGSHPASFTAPSQTFSLTVSTTMTSTWTVSGAGSIVNVAKSGITFSDGGFIFTSTGITVSVANGATLKFMKTDQAKIGTLGAAGTLSPGSTVEYAATSGAQNIKAATYSNLTISGTTAIQLFAATVVNKALTINAGCALTLNTKALTLNGTIAGAGTITGDVGGASIIVTSNAANLGTITFTSGDEFLNEFSLESGNGDITTLVTLGSNLTIIDGGGGTSLLDLSTCTLNLNGHTLATDATCVNIILSADPTFNIITGSNTSAIQLNCASGGSISGAIFLDQTSTASSSLSSLMLNDADNVNTVTIGNAINIIDSISPTLGTIDASGGNYVTLIADQATVGHVGRIGMISGTFMGNISSQVYHDPSWNNTNWVLLGSAGVVGTTFSDWDITFKITCPTCPDGDGSAQNSGTPFTSIDAYNETLGAGDPNAAAHYVGINAITDFITDGNGFWAFIGNTQPGASTGGNLITVTGTPQTGNFAWSLTNTGGGGSNGYNSLANPYPSPVSWAKVVARNSNAITTYYAWNCFTQDYSIYNTVTGSNTSGSYTLTDVIPAGLGFYVQTGSNISFNVQEGDKTAGNQIIGRMASPNTVQSSTPYFSLMIDGATSNDHKEATISFNPNSIAGLDAYDAVAFPWNGVSQITTISQGHSFAINSMPGLTQNYAIPVKILSGTTTQYTISTKNLQNIPAGACLKLHDNYGVMADQDLHGGAFTVTINDSETVARFVLNVTITPLMITTNAVDASCHAKNDGLITVVGNDAGPWNYIWKNASGTVVKTSLNKVTADTLTGLNNGVFSVDVSTVGTCNSATQTFTVVAPAGAAAAFTASSQVNVGDNVVLTNNSANATNYVWNFGDGDISSMQTPSYIYNNSGTYTITLQAINANCNDTASFTQVITVNATSGIKQASTGDGNINLSRDASGNYIQFDYTNQTKVNITVYNVLGQVVLDNAALTVINDKIYLNITDNKNQVLYVNITNLNTNKQTTKKFVND